MVYLMHLGHESRLFFSGTAINLVLENFVEQLFHLVFFELLEYHWEIDLWIFTAFLIIQSLSIPLILMEFLKLF